VTDPRSRPHPYIPNAIPGVRAAMLEAVGATSIDEFYADIPPSLRLAAPLDLPRPLRSEVELVRHVEGLLGNTTSTRDALSFLGAGCYQHHVPAVCDEINGRSEFLTAYAGEPYEDHGRFQALFEYASMMGELLEMDVVNVPVYDGFQASSTALRMAGRLTGRRRVLVPASLGRDKRSRILDYVRSELDVEGVPWEPSTGLLDLGALGRALGDDVAAVLVENPGHLGVVEERAAEIAALAHAAGALAIGDVDPSTLGVLAPPAAWGADLACGDIQPLGMHQQYGGGHGGFIASHDDPRVVAEFPSRLFGIAPTAVAGEYGFGDVAYERTSFALREEGKEWVGTAAALWGITAGVYLALMGPQGMRELGETMMARTRYAMERLAAIPGVAIPFAGRHHVKEFVVDLSGTGRTVADVARALLERGIFLGADLSREQPSLGQAALVCVTEVHAQPDIDRLAGELAEVLR
jgi:glycine cleavage system P protein (glycine dehydrogenase) subunit 1